MIEGDKKGISVMYIQSQEEENIERKMLKEELKSW